MKGKEILTNHGVLQRRFEKAQERLAEAQTNYDAAKKELSDFNDKYGLRLKVLKAYPDDPSFLQRLLGR